MTKGKQKGSEWERKCCKTFSLWWTDGKRKDIFWRTASSGGRFSQGHCQTHSGDMCAIDPIGEPLIEKFSFEFKHYKEFNLFELIDPPKKTYLIEAFWQQCVEDAEKAGKEPWLVMKRNMFKPYMILPRKFFNFAIDLEFRFLVWRGRLVCGLEPFLERVPSDFLMEDSRR